MNQLQMPVLWQGLVTSTHIMTGVKAGSKGCANYRLTGSWRGSGCWHALSWLLDLTKDVWQWRLVKVFGLRMCVGA